MKRKRILTGALAAGLLLLGASIHAQVSRPYRNGSVWQVAFIKMKPGMDSAYLNYLAGDWKREQEALKSEGITLSYKVLSTESHSSGDWNLLLMTEYKDLATMESTEAKADALTQRVIGDDTKMRQGYKDRLEIREVLGVRLAREIILEPRR
ncbi:MAG: hypothetical protein HY650_16725 [Acidobacteria bacterium]|nr:hypothetical protein [Acidobacteriota bacterium]